MSDTETDVLTGDVEYVRVKLTEDVGEIFGVDEEVYVLEAGDVVEIPRTNAGPLFQHGVAFPVE